MQDIIPQHLLIGNRTDEFLAWLRGLRIDAEDKKQLLMLWADRVGKEVTGDMIRGAGLK